MQVLYVYRCKACGHRGDVHREDDSHDGEAIRCERCSGPVTLEWDGGVMLGYPERDLDGSPAAKLKALRAMHRITQAGLAERLRVSDRQVQRWEANDGEMPEVYWQVLRQTLGFHTARDLERATRPTRGWDTARDVARDTIACGDVVELQPLGGPLLCATVCATFLAGTMGYEAIVTGFVGADDIGEEHRGVWLGERVRFEPDNVIHLEQRAPRAARSIDRSVRP